MIFFRQQDQVSIILFLSGRLWKSRKPFNFTILLGWNLDLEDFEVLVILDKRQVKQRAILRCLERTIQNKMDNAERGFNLLGIVSGGTEHINTNVQWDFNVFIDFLGDQVPSMTVQLSGSNPRGREAVMLDHSFGNIDQARFKNIKRRSFGQSNSKEFDFRDSLLGEGSLINSNITKESNPVVLVL